MANDVVGYDSETWPILDGNKAPRLVCGMFYDGRGDASIELRERTTAQLRTLLASGATLAIHNAAFDMCAAIESDPSLLGPVVRAYKEQRIRCTYVRQKLLNLGNGTSKLDPMTQRAPDNRLSGCCARYRLGEKDSNDPWRLRFHELDGIAVEQWPPEAQYYARNDAVMHWRVFQAQGGTNTTIPDEHAQTMTAFWLQLAACNGFWASLERVEALDRGLEEEIGNVMEELKAMGSTSIRGSVREKQLRELVLSEYGEDLVPRTEPTPKMIARAKAAGEEPVGNVSISGMALVGCKDPRLKRYGMAKKAITLRRGLVKTLRRGAHVPICPRYDVVKDSGRVSSSKPQVQNFARDGGYRECIVPRRNHLFVSADYDQIELCTLAQHLHDLFGENELERALKEKIDLHCYLAGFILGIPYEQVDKVAHAVVRQFAKIGNYGFWGLMGAATMLENILEKVFKRQLPASFGATTIEEVEQLRAAWQVAYPTHEPFFDWVTALHRSGEPLIMKRSGRWKRGGSASSYANTCFQGPAADGATAALRAVSEECYMDRGSALYGSRVALFLHDELILETPSDIAPDAGERLSEIMIREMQRFTPDIPVGASPVLSTCWSKKAETLRDDAGRLIPWSP